MSLKKADKILNFRGINITFEKESYFCPVCGLGASNLTQAGSTQSIIANSYRRAMGLLTGDEIRETRKKLGLSRKALADKMNVSVANIKRWEGSIIQSESENNLLRQIFENNDNRNFAGSDSRTVGAGSSPVNSTSYIS